MNRHEDRHRRMYYMEWTFVLGNNNNCYGGNIFNCRRANNIKHQSDFTTGYEPRLWVSGGLHWLQLAADERGCGSTHISLLADIRGELLLLLQESAFCWRPRWVNPLAYYATAVSKAFGDITSRRWFRRRIGLCRLLVCVQTVPFAVLCVFQLIAEIACAFGFARRSLPKIPSTCWVPTW